MDSENHDFLHTRSEWATESSNRHLDDVPTINSTNPNYHSTSVYEKQISRTENPVIDSILQKERGQKQVEDIFSRARRIFKSNWEQIRRSAAHSRKKIGEMVPNQAMNLIYWRRPIQSGIFLGVSLSIIITFMFLSALAAISFWLLATLITVGLYKLYNYLMATFMGRVNNDIFELIFPPDVHISERQAQALANSIRVNGTNLLKQGRNLFLWNNITASVIFGLVLFVLFYIGLSMNTLTCVLIFLLFIFTIPKIYQVYQVPIDRTAKKILDQINQLLAKITAKLPNKAKKA